MLKYVEFFDSQFLSNIKKWFWLNNDDLMMISDVHVWNFRGLAIRNVPVQETSNFKKFWKLLCR